MNNDAGPINTQEHQVMNGKPVIWRENIRTVLSLKSNAFQEKCLCDGITLNLGDACGYSCRYCYVESQARKLLYLVLGDKKHDQVVIRRSNALEVLKQQLLDRKGQPRFNSVSKKVVFVSTLVDCMANMTLVRETAAACCLIFDYTHWDVRLLTKSNLLPQLVKLIPEKWHRRLIFGVSIGTLDDGIAKAIEVGTPLISKRLQSLHWMQDNGFRTYGMICPSLPQEDYVKFSQDMVQAIRIEKCEDVWAEVINVRGESFTRTVAALEAGGFEDEANRLRVVSEDKEAWERYARDTFEAHASTIPHEKLHFLQYVTKKTMPYWSTQKARGAVLLGKIAHPKKAQVEEKTL